MTRENTTALASFWGHMDIHTYSYAAAGGILGIDKKLYEEIPETDIRRKWFNTNSGYNYCPENKFYHGTMDSRHDPIKTGTLNGVDRNWLNDVVYMRIEEAFLLAAEAAYAEFGGLGIVGTIAVVVAVVAAAGIGATLVIVKKPNLLKKKAKAEETAE